MTPNPVATPAPTTRQAPAHETPAGGSAHQPYAAPALECLGPWSALTLQQTIPVTFMADPERAPKLG